MRAHTANIPTYIILVNDRVSGDLISISSHFNPYQVSLRRIDTIPRIYVNLLVTTATLHKSMQQDENFVRSSALVQREEDIFRFRISALQDVNHRLSKKDTQTSDSTLMCVICLLLSTVSILKTGYTMPALVLWFCCMDGWMLIMSSRCNNPLTRIGEPTWRVPEGLFSYEVD